MTSEPARIGSVLARLQAQAAARVEWETQNQALAAEWNDALTEDETRIAAKQRAVSELRLIDSIATRLPDMGVPVRIAEAVQAEQRLPETARQFWESRAMKAARRFVAERHTFLLLLGGVGAGKSCAACWTLLQARGGWSGTELDRNHGRFVRAAEAARISRFNDDGQWRDLLRVPWLVIDDLGVEAMSDYWSERINELIDTRYGNRLATALTSNLNAAQFKATNRYGERISSRIRDDGVVVGCGDEDHRRQQV